MLVGGQAPNDPLAAPTGHRPGQGAGVVQPLQGLLHGNGPCALVGSCRWGATVWLCLGSAGNALVWVIQALGVC